MSRTSPICGPAAPSTGAGFAGPAPRTATRRARRSAIVAGAGLLVLAGFVASGPRLLPTSHDLPRFGAAHAQTIVPPSRDADETMPTPASADAGTIPLFGALAGLTGLPASLGAGDEAPSRIALEALAGPSAADPAGEDGRIELFGPRLALAAPPAEGPAGEASAPAPAEDLPVAALWPLDPSRLVAGRARLSGEIDVVDFALFVPPGAPPQALTIGAVSSAFILPDRSVLRIHIGDALIGEMPLRSITGTESRSFPLRPGQLRPGLNRVRIESRLVHRLYCGAEASYDLWTSLDLAASGVPYRADSVGRGPEAFLAAAAVTRGAGRPLLVRGPSATDSTAVMADVGRELAAIMGGGLSFTTRAAAADGRGHRAPAIEIRDGASPAADFRIDDDGRQTLEIRLGEGRLPDLGAVFGLLSPAGAPPLLPTEAPVPIATLGFSTIQIAQNLWRESIEFRLPADWLVNVRKRAVLDLAHAYLPGMPTGSELRVLVNGSVVRIIPLDRGGRLDEVPLEVRFDAGLLRAGRNAIGFEVNVPGDPADQPCPVAEVGRIEIGARSTLLVPASPRMHLPGIGRWMAAPIDPTIESASATQSEGDWNLALRLAAALRAEAAERAADGEKRLVVLRPETLSQAAFGDFSVGRQVMLSALQQPQAPRRPGSAAETASTGLTFTVERTGIVERSLADARGLGQQIATSLSRLALPDPVSDLGDWLGDRRGQAMLFQLDREAPDDLHLLLAGDADVDTVLVALEGVARRGVALDGHVALLGWDGIWQTWTDHTRLPVLEEPLTEANWRGVIGNFASARPIGFVGTLIGFTLISVLLANSYVGASRRQR